MYENVFFNVVKNAVAMYVVELLQHCLKQPEPNAELYFFLEDTLKQLDRANDSLTANLPLYFNLLLANELGFRMLGEYSAQTPVLDLKEGLFTGESPVHPNYIINETAQLTSNLYAVKSYSDLENFHLNRHVRRQLLEAYLQFIALHIEDFGELKSFPVLQEVLS